MIRRASARTAVEAVFVANRELPEGEGEGTRFVRVERAEGAADSYIIDSSAVDDLVVTRDLPLARLLVERGSTVLNDRGDVYTAENVGERTSMRDFMYELRRQGLAVPAGRSYGRRELHAFANALDRELTRLLQRGY